MTTHTQLTASPRSARPNRLRRLASVAALAPLLAVAACSGEAPVTANPTRRPAATAASTSTPGSTSTTATATETTATPEAEPTRSKVSVRLEVPTLGHVIKVHRVVRNITWPEGNPVAEEAFELVGIRVTLAAGDRFTATLAPSQLFLRLGDVDVKSTTEFAKAFEKTYGPVVEAAKRGEVKKGWLYFKIDRGVSPLVLEYHRPAYQVSTTDKTIEAHVYSRKLLD
ncbi:hypothetical protein OO014_17595 [Intrasporangium calvum]|uniref:Lipoprotein n=1 Tax=Intrasporangium calvum TaxID=53358 RepID=A0ABT5GLH9_9MICO|nr:hypothetical protein [Intrasporangium calvum]MDC5699067.1 hypothetical protein [Intrasporangium calvum]